MGLTNTLSTLSSLGTAAVGLLSSGRVPAASIPRANNYNTSSTIQPSKRAVNKVYKNNSFTTQEFKTIKSPLSFSTDRTLDKDRVNTLTTNELSSLSTLSGVSIKNDDDLDSALKVMSSKFSTTLGTSGINLAGRPTIESVAIQSDFDSINAEIFADNIGSSSQITDLKSEVLNNITKDVPNVTDPDGNRIFGIPDTANYTQTQSIANTLKGLCGNVNSSMYNNGQNVALYNALLALLSKLGLSSLLAQAVACAKFFGVGGQSTLKRNLPSTYNTGDYNTYYTASSSIGQGNISDPYGKLYKLSSNIPKKQTVDLNAISSIMSLTGMTSTKATTYRVPNTSKDAISKTKVNKLGNSTVQDYLVGADTMKLFKKLPFLQ